MPTWREVPAWGGLIGAWMRMRILIAENDKDVAETLAAMTRLFGHVATMVYDLGEAVTARKEGLFDVYLIDLDFSDCGGPALLGALRHGERRGRMARAVAWTAQEAAWRSRPVVEAFDCFVAKPASFHTMIAALNGRPCPECARPLDAKHFHSLCQWFEARRSAREP